MNDRKKCPAEPERYPFTQWQVYGSPIYGIVPGDPVVEFVDPQTGKRTTIIDGKRAICHFPGIENQAEIEKHIGEGSLLPYNLFGVRFSVEDAEHYRMAWTVQLDGRFWEDEEGFGGTPDNEIELYALLDREGRFVTPFRLKKR